LRLDPEKPVAYLARESDEFEKAGEQYARKGNCGYYQALPIVTIEVASR
jgi:hypothetical protein